MRVRIRKRPTTSYEGWYVEVKKWWYLDWLVVEIFAGDDAKEKALKFAKEYKNPTMEAV